MNIPNDNSIRSARHSLAVFFLLLITLSVPAYWMRITGISSLAILFPPALASIITRLILREGFRDVSFSFRGHNLRKVYLIAYLFPMVVSLAAYGFTWLSGLTQFDFSVIQSGSRIPLPGNTVLGFLCWILVSWTVVTAIFMIFVAGEEIGWRGYMLTRLIDSGLPNPLLIHGLIWSIYHYPLIIAGVYSAASGPSMLFSIFMFTVIATAFSYLLAWVRLESGIIWPSFVAHAVSNALTQNVFNPVTHGENSMLWIGESGIVMAIVLVCLIFIVRKQFFNYPMTKR